MVVIVVDRQPVTHRRAAVVRTQQRDRVQDVNIGELFFGSDE